MNAENMPDEYLSSVAMFRMTGIPSSTWRYWASIGTGPASFKIGRRRVWKKSLVLAWLAEQESATLTGGMPR